MRPLLVLLERLWGPLGASSTALGASLGGSWQGLGSSSGALEDVFSLGEPLCSKMGAPPRREHDFRNLYEQEREASYRGSVFFRLG